MKVLIRHFNDIVFNVTVYNFNTKKKEKSPDLDDKDTRNEEEYIFKKWFTAHSHIFLVFT